LDDPQSLEDITFWNNLFEEYNSTYDRKTIKYLIAMKMDTNHSEKETMRQKAKAIAEENGYRYHENVTSMSPERTVFKLFSRIYEDFI